MAETTPTPELSYFAQRCEAIGLTTDKNKLLVPEFAAMPNSKVFEFPLLAEDEKNGDVLIPLYDIEGKPCVYNKAGTATKTGTTTAARATNIEVRRFHPDTYARMCEEAERAKKPTPGKYKNPYGAKTLPWLSPNIIEAYRNKTVVDTLVITEGYIKAISGYLNGLYIVGLAGIQNTKDKDTCTLHGDILAAIKTLKVKNIVLLYDGDCTNVSLKAIGEGKDISARPRGFFTSARNIVELLKDHRKEIEFDIYFAHVNTDALDSQPKGLDDVYQTFTTDFDAITKELTTFSRQKNHYFQKFNITYSLSKVYNHLHLVSAEMFYTAHSQTIKDKAFIFGGTKYQWSEDDAAVKIIIPGAAKNYFRVGDNYFEKLHVPNKNGVLEYQYHRRLIGTIQADHGKDFVKHIAKYKAFCTKPDHVSYEEVISNCFNRYKPFEHEPSEDSTECPETLSFLKHIFGDQLEIGLDYIQLLYQRPTQTLPILCLVSKENKTGKSTLGKLLKAIFTGNMATIGNADLENDFNAGWADKLIICCEESFIDKKKTMEKIKSLSTGDKIQMNMKGVDQIEIDFFGKFIFMSNNEDNFIIANEYDERFWVRRVPQFKDENVNLLAEMCAEIPNFLHYLNKRQMKTQNTSRMWFAKEDLRTEALKKLIEGNKSAAEREIRHFIRHTMLEYGFKKLQYNLKFIVEDVLRKRYESSYVEKLFNEKIKVEKTSKTTRYKYVTIVKEYEGNSHEEKLKVQSGTGKPYIFYAEEFLLPEEITTLEECELAKSIGFDVPQPEPVSAQTEIIINQNIEEPF